MRSPPEPAAPGLADSPQDAISDGRRPKLRAERSPARSSFGQCSRFAPPPNLHRKLPARLYGSVDRRSEAALAAIRRPKVPYDTR